MLRQQKGVLSLELAIKAAVYSHREHSTVHAICEANGWNPTTFRNSINPTTPSHKCNIHHLEGILAYTKDLRILDALCSIHGNAVCIELPPVTIPDQANYLAKMGELAREQGELSSKIALAVADGLLTACEVAQVEQEVFELVRVATQLLKMVKTHGGAA